MGASESRLQRGRYASSAFLTRPVTEQTGSAGMGNDTRFGLSYMQGWRAHMEDAHIATPALDKLQGSGFYCVLDGHAGSKVAEHSAQELEALVQEEVLPVRGSPAGMAEALQRVFLRHDLAMQRNFEVLRSRSGSTCTCVLITPSHYIFANLGDSRTVLCRAGRVAFATHDHKPTTPSERARIKGAGGYVVGGRVDGGLAVSRAFGDFEYKMRTDLPAVRQKVSAEPDTHTVPREPGRDEFLLLACDGIWDVMTNQAACKFVSARLKKGSADLEGVCQALIKRCLQLGSRDNMSVILVTFNAAGGGKGAATKVFASTHSEALESGAGDSAATVEELADQLAMSVAHTAVAGALASMKYCLTGSSVLPHETIPDPVSHDESAHTSQQSHEYLEVLSGREMTAIEEQSGPNGDSASAAGATSVLNGVTQVAAKARQQPQQPQQQQQQAIYTSV